MIERLRSFFIEYFKPHSSIDALKRILPRSQFHHLLLTTPDRRYCFERAAALTGKEIHEILNDVSLRMRLPILPKLMPLPKEAIASLPEKSRLQIGAAFPLCSGAFISGVSCVDPALMKAVLPEFAHLPLFLSSWSEIQQALDANASGEAPEHFPLCTQVLRHLAQEIKKYESQSCTIFFDDVVSYHIPIDDGRKAYGEIHGAVRDELVAGLLSLANNKTQNFIFGTQDRFTVTGYHKEFRIEIAGGSQAMQTPALELIRTTPQAQGAAHTGTVLIIDDNSTFARVLDRYLSKHGIPSVHVENGQIALEAIRSGSIAPSIVVCDIHMPLVNGFEFVKTIRTEQSLAHLPIIMLTSDVDVEAEVTLLSYGIEAFVGKNEDPRILYMHVKRIFDRNTQLAA